MKTHIVTNDGRPIAIYNSIKKELIGIFSNVGLAAKYLNPADNRAIEPLIRAAALRNGSVLKSKLKYKIAVRFANEIQRAELSNQDVVIKDGYPEFNKNSLIGFHESRLSLSLKRVIK